MIGDCHYNLAEFAEAVRAYERALKLARESAILESKCGLAKVRLGHAEAGLKQIRNSIQQEPALPETHDRLILSLVWLARDSDAALAAEDKLQSVKAPSRSDFTRAASLWTKASEWARATSVLRAGLTIYQEDPKLKCALDELAARARTQVGELTSTLSDAETVVSGD
jgi:tetratricopeptide (TPR) repeat protein